MKFVFKPYPEYTDSKENNGNILLRLFFYPSEIEDAKKNRKDPIQEFRKRLQQSPEGEAKVEEIRKQYQALYDAADIIYDKRLDKDDIELQHFKESDPKVKNSDECEQKVMQKLNNIEKKLKNAVKPEQQQTIGELALRKLLDYAELELSGQKDADIFPNPIYAGLAKGNLCRRISNLFADCYDYEKSELWGNRANECFWYGKEELNKHNPSIEDDFDGTVNDFLLKQLAEYNLARYYMDFASRNRRRDYSSAESHLNDVKNQIQRRQSKGKGEARRIINLIGAYARYYLLIVKNRMNRANSIINAMKQITVLIEKRVVTNDCDRENAIAELTSCLHVLTQTFTSTDPDAPIDPPIDLRGLVSYDIDRLILLLSLFLAECLQDQYNPSHHINAISIAADASKLSNSMDANENINVDALIIISSSLRKYYTYSKPPRDLHTKIQSEFLEKCTIKYKSDSMGDFERGLFAVLRIFSENGHLHSKTELIKWYCLEQHTLGWLRQRKLPYCDNWKGFPDKSYVEELFETDNQYREQKNNGEQRPSCANVLLEFYRGKVLLDSANYQDAAEVFDQLVDPKGKYYSHTSYVRYGTLGLNAHYLLANANMSLKNYNKAKTILEKIDRTLKEVYELMLEESPQDYQKEYEPVYPDHRVLIDLSYCYIMRGDYKQAISLFKEYSKILNCSTNQDNPQYNYDCFLIELPKSKRSAGINNLITCHLLSGIRKYEKIGKELLAELDNMVTPHESFDNTLSAEDFSDDPETNLLRGYRAILEGKEETAGIYFKKSYVEYIAHKAWYSSDEKIEQDLGEILNRVEYLSAYLVNQINLSYRQKSNSSFNDYDRNIADMLKSFPKNCSLSLNAAMKLADWLISCEKKQNKTQQKREKMNEASSTSGIKISIKEERILKEEKIGFERLYRDFSNIRIYEERGAIAFNDLELRDDGQFRTLRPEQRGTILAYLLALYQPINQLKEQRTYSIEELRKEKGKNQENAIVHYTTMNTVKALIGDSPSKFRLSNCGYANDLYEGRIFFECLDQALYNRQESIRQEIAKLIRRYFGLVRGDDGLSTSECELKVNRSDVYIASFSNRKDSFPMWTIYAQNETGCNIEFGDEFFDILGGSKTKSLLADYLPSRYSERDYPLYVIQYVKKDRQPSKDHISKVSYPSFPNKIKKTTKKELEELLVDICDKWIQLDVVLSKEESKSSSTATNTTNTQKKAIETARSFAADLINEVRFLFKDADFSYEGEVRLVYTDTKQTAKINYARDIPIPYVEMDRDLKDLTITLGSKLSYSDLDRIETWLKQTNRVKRVKPASTNRQNEYRPIRSESVR